MLTFAEIRARALARHPDFEPFGHYWREPLPPDDVVTIPDDRWLSAMTFSVFSAGFRWSVIAAKWDGFEDAFIGFEPEAVADFDPGMLEGLRHDTRIVRNPQKIGATIENAKFVRDVSNEHGGFGAWVASYGPHRVTELLAVMKKRGSRLGGSSGPRTLRRAGADAFIVTGDVEKALREMGALTASPTSKKGQRETQAAFNQWMDESGRSLTEISITLAHTVDQ